LAPTCTTLVNKKKDEFTKKIPSNVEKVLDKGERKLNLDEKQHDVVHKATINVVELEN
jgi:hypothetical protein